MASQSASTFKGGYSLLASSWQTTRFNVLSPVIRLLCLSALPAAVFGDVLPSPVNHPAGAPYDVTGIINVWANFSNGTHESNATGVVAVHSRLLLTAAHVVYDSQRDFEFLPLYGGGASVTWRHNGEQTVLRGSRLMSSYADLAKAHGRDSREAFSQDFAVLFAYEALTASELPQVSSEGASLLQGGDPKIIVGYPQGLYHSGGSLNGDDRFKVHGAGPFVLPFSKDNGAYYRLAGVSMGPGASGGGVWILSGDRPTLAGVHVSGRSTLNGDSTNVVGAVAMTPDHLSLAQGTIAYAESYSTPQILTFPQPPEWSAAGVGKLSVVANGNEPLTYQWHRRPVGRLNTVTLQDDDVFSGTNTATLVINDPLAIYADHEFLALVINPMGSKSTPWMSLNYPDLSPPSLTFSHLHWLVSAEDNPILPFVLGGRPFPTIEWGYGGAIWEPLNADLIAETRPDGVVIRAASLPFRDRPLQARLSNSLGTTYSAPITLEYLDLRAPSLDDSYPREFLVLQDQDNYIRFDLQGAPFPALHWEYRYSPDDPWRTVNSSQFGWGHWDRPELHFNWRSWGGRGQFRLVAENALGKVTSQAISVDIAIKPSIKPVPTLIPVDGSGVEDPDWHVSGYPAPELDRWLYSWNGDDWRRVPPRYGMDLSGVLAGFAPYNNPVQLRAVFANAAGETLSETLYPTQSMVLEDMTMEDGSVFALSPSGEILAEGKRIIIPVRNDTLSDKVEWHTLIHDPSSRRWRLESVSPPIDPPTSSRISDGWIVVLGREPIVDSAPMAYYLRYYRQDAEHRWQMVQEFAQTVPLGSSRAVHLHGRWAAFHVDGSIFLYHLHDDGIWRTGPVLEQSELFPDYPMRFHASALFKDRLYILLSGRDLAIFDLENGSAKLVQQRSIPNPSNTISWQYLSVGDGWIQPYSSTGGGRLYELPAEKSGQIVERAGLTDGGPVIVHSGNLLLAHPNNPRLIHVGEDRGFKVVRAWDTNDSSVIPSRQTTVLGDTFLATYGPYRADRQRGVVFADLSDLLPEDGPPDLAPLDLRVDALVQADGSLRFRFQRLEDASYPNVWWSADGVQWHQIDESRLQLDRPNVDGSGTDEWVVRIDPSVAGSALLLQLRE